MRGAKLFLSAGTSDGWTSGIPGNGFLAFDACTNPPVIATPPPNRAGMGTVVMRAGSNPTKRPSVFGEGTKEIVADAQCERESMCSHANRRSANPFQSWASTSRLFTRSP